MIVERRRTADAFADLRRTAVSGLSNLILRIAGLASTFLLGVLLARALGPAEYGLYGLVATLAALGMNIALLGIPQLAIREFSIRKDRSDWNGIRSLTRKFSVAVASASLAIALITLLCVISLDNGRAQTTRLAIPGVLLLAFMAGTALIAAQLRGLGQLVKGQAMDIFGRPIAAFAVLACLAGAGFKLSASLALWVQVAVAMLAVMISFAWLHSAISRQTTGCSSATPWLAAALP